MSTFKPDKNVKLATYASRCIENAILTHWPISPILHIVGRREVNAVPSPVGAIVPKEIDVDPLAVPYDVLDDQPERQTLLLHRHVVHRAGKGFEHIPQDFKRLRLDALLL